MIARETSFFAALTMVVALVSGCGSETGGGTTTSGGSGGSGSTSSTTGGEDCGMSFCGCWTEETLTFDASVVALATNAPIEGIEVYCGDEEAAVATSDVAGKVTFTLTTMVSPGCGLERCNNLRFHSPDGTYMDQTGGFEGLNGKTVSMQ
jgi:hypothetical protein